MTCCLPGTDVTDGDRYLTYLRYDDTKPTSSTARRCVGQPQEHLSSSPWQESAVVPNTLSRIQCTRLHLEASFHGHLPFIFHLSPRLCPPTAGCSLHQCLPFFLFQVVPPIFAMSSCHLLHGRPLDLFPLLGCHSVQRLVHLLSFILAISFLVTD